MDIHNMYYQVLLINIHYTKKLYKLIIKMLAKIILKTIQHFVYK